MIYLEKSKDPKSTNQPTKIPPKNIRHHLSEVKSRNLLTWWQPNGIGNKSQSCEIPRFDWQDWQECIAERLKVWIKMYLILKSYKLKQFLLEISLWISSRIQPPFLFLFHWAMQFKLQPCQMASPNVYKKNTLVLSVKINTYLAQLPLAPSPAGSWVYLMSLGPKNSSHSWSALNLLQSTQRKIIKGFHTFNCKQYLIKILVINSDAFPHKTLDNTSYSAYFSEDKSQKGLLYEKWALLHIMSSNNCDF